MVWFRIDDGFGTSRKVLQIPKRRRPAAVGVWTLAGAWCARELTDGRIPRYALDEIPSGSQYAADLVSVGLWDVTDDGWVFHDWQEYQPSKEDVLKERAGHAARQKAYRDRRAAERDASRNASRDAPVTVPSVTAPRPDPTRPDPTRPVVPTELPTEVQKTKALTPQAAPRSRITVDEFVEFWNAYPRKVGKDAARRAFTNARKRAPLAEIVAGAARFAADPNREDAFTPHPASWLNAGRWADETPIPARPNPAARPSTTDARVTAGLDLARRLAAEEQAAEAATARRLEIAR